MNFVLGLIIFGIGLLIVVKSEAMLEFFGRIEFFERYLGTSGGSRLGYKLTGIAFIFIGTLMMTGLIGGFLGWVSSPLTKYNQ